ncbi:MAG: acetyl-CoA carboxylase biotin carboxylase subunit [Chloroflexi bacterium]|nr:acetyl-CoA carboxylase biotin carboxylase subunit [Chloroflexota bacterium]
MFTKVLIANRGEIAVRIIRACQELGVGTVAVYSEADRTAAHVRHADEAFLIGPPPARASYLRGDKLIEVARRAGAEAVHPGYGFLAENAEFAAACAAAGLVFIGPSPEAIRLLGDKTEARRLAAAHGVPTVPGTLDPLADAEAAARAASIVGFPVMLKAAGGGGGKGMRIVRSVEDLADAFRLAAGEAMSAFGRSEIYLERALERVRHVEIQLLGDRQGNLVYLGERECSIQRRHQKLIEESPSPAVDPELRARLGAAAVATARAAGYYSAGTVEFLLDQDRSFYFLEVNTRLQVEHPVTELVTGIDLVKEQLRVASGEPLGFTQADIHPRGWAIECRVTAEDPGNNFLPSIGKVTAAYEPSGPGVRVDSAVYEGFEVTPYYDSMVAKVIVWGETREAAIERMRRALGEYKLVGVKSTVPFHLRVMANPEFVRGNLDTGFIEREHANEEEGHGHERVAAVVAALLAHQKRQRGLVAATTAVAAPVSGWRRLGWREAVTR